MLDINLLVQYKAWANDLTFAALNALAPGEATKQRPTRFGSMLHTLNHVYVIDAIFKAHLLGEAHGYTARNTPEHPPLDELWEAQAAMDRWYIDYTRSTTDAQLAELVEFAFVDGGQGCMSRLEMLMHVVNHGTYHRGFVGDLMYQVPAMLPANDLPVFLRERTRVAADV
nr:DinB family protein [uncultured Pseudomonas sp.]